MSLFCIHPDDRLAVWATDASAEFAAGQLMRYMAHVRGRDIDPQASTRPAIHVHCDPGAGLSDEGFRFSLADRTLTILGGGPLGASYGVFTFLREACGCRFAGPGPDGESVPRLDEVRFDVDGRDREPVLGYRGLQFTTLEPIERESDRLDWMLKNGLNYAMVRFMPDEETFDEVDPQTGVRHTGRGRGAMGSEGPRMTERYLGEHLLPRILERGLKVDVSHHNLRCWLPPQRWAASHPQWFAMHDGVRGRDLRQLCICTTNHQAINALVDRLDAFLSTHSRIEQVGVIPEDGMGMCECPTCVAMDDHPDDATRPWLGPLHPNAINLSKSRRYARLLNDVAEALAPRHPRVKVAGAAYVDLAYPPLDVDPADNVVMWLAIYWRDGARPLAFDDASPINRRFRGLIEQWSRRMKGRVYLYEYYMGMNAQHSLPYPMSNVIAEDWRQLAGVAQGAAVQCLTSLHDAYGLNLLTFARAGWSPEVDHAAVLEDWLIGMFGAAGEAVRPIYERWLEAVASIAEPGATTLPKAAFIDEGMFKPDARNIVHLMADMPAEWIASTLARARATAVHDRELRQLARLEHYLSYCLAAAALVERVSQTSATCDEVESALNNVLRHIGHACAEGWIAPAHAVRWQRMARPRLVKEAAV